ncbi:endonuclease domain-containing protein [Mucilaginibacter myungsuensis]|uniref:DUF559 domain-containing protein n=1 Tax=Mucilaginibacter myungsuensis TaxID=649104 RepID=A0A929PXH2_9SPHI|nr:DUF559 domain-containing protein [Mucilaginibacter myungsuensis]MBE9663858.1 DUF559 domain-containing protein [Mucilaginibacter myungsuensis]MDN3598427.1 DUF559 domain-containing protein [Mucilaginibacter myungsuensis]
MPTITEICRELRRRETPAEKVLWQHLRNRQLLGYKFLRQYPITTLSAEGRRICFIPDLYCHQAKLVIEADGPIHLLKKEYDVYRDEVLLLLGITTLRFTNDEILFDTNSVLNRISEQLMRR